MNKDYDHSKWYDTVYPLLSNYGLWLRGGEINTLPKEEYSLRPFRVLLTRLSTYKDVASSFTHSLLYQIAASIPDVFPDIAYLPPHNDAKIFEKDNIPWLLGTQTKFSAKAFDLVGFSNSIVQEILNIPKFLETSGIPLNRSERLEREDIPLVILGGANSLYTTSIWGNDSWVDGLFIGYGVSEIRKLLEICASGRKRGRIKKEILDELKCLPGFYSTDSPANARKMEKFPLEDPQILEKGIVPYKEEEIGKGYIPISEGCRASCSFCAENWLRKPYKELNASFLLEKAVRMKTEMGLEQIDLSSFNFNMHSEFYKILWDFSPFFNRVGLKSQRFDMLAADPAMVEYEHAAGKSIFSFGLEGISARLRKYLNKNLDDNILRRSLELVFKMKARELKIFILSTGLEDDADFSEFNRFLKMTREIMEMADAKTRVIFSITPIVKFPWTPLEFDKACLPDLHDKVISRICREVKGQRFEVREAMGTNEYAVSQILVRASDDRIKQALLNALKNTGFTYYNAVREPFFSLFMKALSKEGVEIKKLFECFSFEDSMSKPWASVDTGLERQSLWEIYGKNVNFAEVGTSLDKLKIQKPEFTVEQFKARALRIQNDEVKKRLYVTVGEKGRGVFRKYFGIALARAIMKAEPSFTPYFRSYASSYWSKDNSQLSWVIGDDVVVLGWDKKAVPMLEKKLADNGFLDLVNAELGEWGKLNAPRPEGKFKIKIYSPYKFEGLGYFKKRNLKYTLFKETEGRYCFKFTGASVKKNIISDLFLTIGVKKDSKIETADSIIEITPGDKFIPEEFVKEAFVCPGKYDWARIRVVSRVT